MKTEDRFTYARLNDATVHSRLMAGASLKDIIVALVEDKQALLDQLMVLDSIAPKAYRVKGKLIVWRCPDDLIPVTELKGGS